MNNIYETPRLCVIYGERGGSSPFYTNKNLLANRKLDTYADFRRFPGNDLKKRESSVSLQQSVGDSTSEKCTTTTTTTQVLCVRFSPITSPFLLLLPLCHRCMFQRAEPSEGNVADVTAPSPPPPRRRTLRLICHAEWKAIPTASRHNILSRRFQAGRT